MHACMHVHTYVRRYVCMYVRTYVCMYVFCLMFPQCVHTWGFHGNGLGLGGSKVGAYVFALFGDPCSVKVPQSSFFAGTSHETVLGDLYCRVRFRCCRFGSLAYFRRVRMRGRRTAQDIGHFFIHMARAILVNLDDGLSQSGTWS